MNAKLLKMLSSIAAAIVATSPAFAKIGDNEAQIEKMYGQPAAVIPRKEFTDKIYAWRDFHVVVSFWRGTSAREDFLKPGSGKFDPKEVAELMTAESEGRKWNETGNKAQEDSCLKYWKREDGKVLCYLNFGDHQNLSFDLPAFQDFSSKFREP